MYDMLYVVKKIMDNKELMKIFANNINLHRKLIFDFYVESYHKHKFMEYIF